MVKKRHSSCGTKPIHLFRLKRSFVLFHICNFVKREMEKNVILFLLVSFVKKGKKNFASLSFCNRNDLIRMIPNSPHPSVVLGGIRACVPTVVICVEIVFCKRGTFAVYQPYEPDCVA